MHRDESDSCPACHHGRGLRVYVDPAHLRRRIATALVAWRSRLPHPHRTYGIRASVALQAGPFYRIIGYQLTRCALAWDGSTALEMTHTLAGNADQPGSAPPASTDQ
jgi:hypothetical protein